MRYETMLVTEHGMKLGSLWELVTTQCSLHARCCQMCFMLVYVILARIPWGKQDREQVTSSSL